MDEYLSRPWAPVNATFFFLYNAMNQGSFDEREAIHLAALDPEIAAHLGPLNADRPILLWEMALALMRNFEISGNLTYAISGSPYFAARSLIAKRWIQGPPERPLRPFEVLELIQAAQKEASPRQLPELSGNFDMAGLTPEKEPQAPETAFFDQGLEIETVHDFAFFDQNQNIFNLNNTSLRYWLHYAGSPSWGFLLDGGLQFSNPVNFSDQKWSSRLFPLLSFAYFYFSFETAANYVEGSLGVAQMGERDSPVFFDPVLGFEVEVFGQNYTVVYQNGFIGGVPARSSSVQMNDTDAVAAGMAGFSLYPKNLSSDYHFFASPRLFSNLAFHYTTGWGAVFEAALTTQFDLRDVHSYRALNIVRERAHSQYLSLSYTESFGGSLYLSGRSSLAFIQNEGKNGVGLSASADLSWYPETTIGLLFFEAGYGSGADDNLLSFMPISSQPLGYLFSQTKENLIWLTTGASTSGHQNFFLAADFYVFFRASTAAGLSGIALADLVDEEAIYLGVEIDIDCTWRPYTDLAVALKAGLFLPDARALNWGIAAKIGLTFVYSL